MRTNRPGRRPTIADVAARARVSKATVSYVLNGDARVASDTAERVRAAVRDLHYRPNRVARALAHERSGIIALALPHGDAFGDPFLLAFLRGVGEGCEAEGREFLVVPTGGSDNVARLEGLWRGGLVDAVVLLDTRVGDDRAARLASAGVPTVSFGRPGTPSDAVAWIDVDNVAGARLATEHLLALGHRTVACVAAPLGFQYAVDRLEGYRRALGAAGLTFDPDLVAEADLSEAGACEVARHLLALPQAPTAFFAHSDRMARGVVRALSEAGWRVPVRASVVGYDHVEGASEGALRLTTVHQPVLDIGRTAARLAVQVADGAAPPPGPHLLVPELVLGDSTAPFAAASRVGT
jgi:DNA-binding LacI/PurR family transcriptional regulator